MPSSRTTGLLTVTEEQFSSLESLFFKIGSVSSIFFHQPNICSLLIYQTTFEFTANAQIWPRALNSTLGGEDGKIYLILSDLGNNSGSGLDFISMTFTFSIP